jgi:hypothetical protein
VRKTRTVQTTIAIATIVSSFLMMNGIALVEAVTKPTGAKALGVGSFLHEHEGMICTHSFLFSVSNGISQADGWYYMPSGAFALVCSNSTTVCMIITSLQIARFRVVPVVGGLSVVFEGLAKVNMGNGWVEDWWFRATGFDYGSPGKNTDAFGLQLWDPDHWSGTIPNLTLNPPEGQHSCEGTLIAGNIIIKAQ